MMAFVGFAVIVLFLALAVFRWLLPFLSPFPFICHSVVGGGGIEVEAEAAVDGASPTGTGNSAARMETEGSGGGAIEEVEADAVVD